MTKALAIVFVLLLRNVMLAQSSTASKAGKPLPSAEITKLMDELAGTWSISAKFKPSEKLPTVVTRTGTEVWRAGPGGLSLIQDYYSTGTDGEIFGLGIAWWDRTTERYQFSWCDSTNSDGCQVLEHGARWEGSQLVLLDERQEQGKTVAIKEVFSEITRTSFKQTIYQAEAGRAFRKTITILATKARAGTVTGLERPAEHRLSLRMPGPAVQNSMLGTFSIEETDAKGQNAPAKRPGQAMEVWRPGPGGYSVIEESYRANGDGAGGAFSPAWWDKQADGQRFVFCSNQLPSGCLLSKNVAKWEGDRNVYTEERMEGGRRIVSREIFEEISNKSFLQLIQKGETTEGLATVRTMRATKRSPAFPIHEWATSRTVNPH